jgi:hypothetical protein
MILTTGSNFTGTSTTLQYGKKTNIHFKNVETLENR